MKTDYPQVYKVTYLNLFSTSKPMIRQYILRKYSTKLRKTENSKYSTLHTT